MLASVQGSLITSVGMLQEQVEYKMYHTLIKKRKVHCLTLFMFIHLTKWQFIRSCIVIRLSQWVSLTWTRSIAASHFKTKFCLRWKPVSRRLLPTAEGSMTHFRYNPLLSVADLTKGTDNFKQKTTNARFTDLLKLPTKVFNHLLSVSFTPSITWHHGAVFWPHWTPKPTTSAELSRKPSRLLTDNFNLSCQRLNWG